MSAPWSWRRVAAVPPAPCDPVEESTREHLRREVPLLDALEAQLADVAGSTEQAALQILGDVQEADGAAGRLAELAADLLARAVDDAEQVALATTSSAEQVDRAVRLVRERHAGVLALVEDVQALARHTDAIATVARATRILALNAKIESVHAGAAGSGFAVVAAEVQALSEQSERAVREIRVGLERVGASIAAGLGEDGSGGFGRIDDELRAVADSQRSLAGALADAATRTRGAAEGVQAAAVELAGRTTLALGRLQFQDVARQSLDAVQQALGGLRGRLGRLSSGESQVEATGHGDAVAALQASYVSQRQRQVHAGALGSPAAGPVAPAVELF